MKDATDTFTSELPWLDSLKADAAANKYRYRFHITVDGERIRWGGLTYKQAMAMFTATEQANPLGVTGFGWEEIK